MGKAAQLFLEDIFPFSLSSLGGEAAGKSVPLTQEREAPAEKGVENTNDDDEGGEASSAIRTMYYA